LLLVVVVLLLLPASFRSLASSSRTIAAISSWVAWSGILGVIGRVTGSWNGLLSTDELKRCAKIGLCLFLQDGVCILR
jgi:hypothetical protein